jgi:hypothetical protein
MPRGNGLSERVAKCFLQSWRIGDKMGISVGAYQPGAKNTKTALRELAAHTLAEVGLTGEIG